MWKRWWFRMANVDMSLVQIGKRYTAVQLAHMWGYKNYHALIKGVVTPAGSNIIVLFITKKKQSGATPYVDKIDGNILYMMGQEKHGSDSRLYENLNNPKDQVYLFYRELHHTPFTYFGRCYLINAVIKKDTPSEFEFLIQNIDDGLDNESDIINYILNVPAQIDETIPFLAEGIKKITQHVRYERNPYNRKEAIRIQGHKCKICGFDFNEVYGAELADDYIEVHHIKQLADGEQIVDPARDLLPVCANCHRMLHRKRKGNIGVEEMKKLDRVKEYRKRFESIEKYNQ